MQISSYFCYFILILNYLIVSIQGQNMYILIKSLSNMDCDNINSYIIPANKIFKPSDMIQTTTNILTFSGWIFLRGYENKYYTIFSIFEGTNQVLSLSYNLDIQMIKMASLTQEFSFLIPNLKKNEWLFFFSSVSYDNSSNNMVAKAFIYKNTSKYSIPQIQQNIIPPHFQKNLIQVNIGLAGNLINTEPSCSFIKNFVLHWDLVTDQAQIGSFIGDISSISSQIIWNFDFFYSKMNPGYLLSSYDNKITKLKLQNQFSSDLNINIGEFFITDYINVDESTGFSFSFDIYLDTAQNNGETQFLAVYFLEDSSLFVSVNENNEISMTYIKQSQPKESVMSFQITDKSWFNMLFILRQGYKNKSYLIMSVGPQNSIISKVFSSSLAYIQFGSINSKRIFKLNNIIIMKGTQFQRNNNCRYQVRNQQNSQECMVCLSTYGIDIENHMSCIDSTTINFSNDGFTRKERTRKDCGKNMIDQSGYCVCSDQFYLKDGECLRCPYSCDGCINPFICKKIADFRGINGKCISNRFDDGYSCIETNQISLDKPKQLEFSYFNPNFICDQTVDFSLQYTFVNNQLNYFSQLPILFTFSFQITDLTQTNGVISVVSDNSNGKILTISYIDSSISLHIQGNQSINIKINPKETFLVGIWSDWSRVIMFVQSNSQILQKESTISLSQLIQNLKICVGPCKSGYIGSYLCGNLNDRPFKFFHNIPYDLIKSQPINEVIQNNKQYQFNNDIIYSILGDEQQLLAYYKTNITSNQPNQQINDDNNNDIFFFDTLKYTNDQIGFYFTEETVGTTIIQQQQSFPFTISVYIFIEQATKSVNIISYEISGFSILYQLVPLDDGTLFSIRICLDLICQDTTYAKLYLNQPNHLMVIPRNLGNFAQDISLIQFEIASNYMRESLNFINNVKPATITSQINFGEVSQLDKISFYLNKIRIYTGNGGIIFNTDNSDNCFIYSNLEQNNCIFPKRGFVTVEKNTQTHVDIVINNYECEQLNQLQSSGIYTYRINYFIKECQIFCKFPYTDFNKNCSCLDGYFQEITNEGQTVCSKCDDKCKTCQNKKNNCLSCHTQNLTPPDCICTQVNTYLDLQSNICLQCSQKCSSCVDNQDNCITCSNGRINPPLCICDSRYYKQEGDQCIKIKCSEKCEKCEDTLNNCVQCKSGRQSPPDCFCQDNYQETITGECIPCPSSTYLESLSNTCLPCEKPCLECYLNKNNCTSCINGFNYDNSQCLCQNGKIGILNGNGEIECLSDMDVNVNLDNKGNCYQFTMIFTQSLFEIQQLKNNNNVNEILDLYIPEIDKKYYTLTDFIFNREQLTFKLSVKSNFSATKAILTIKKREVFKSLDSKLILSNKYNNFPFNFNIGPNLFQENVMSNKNMDNTIDFLKNQNSEGLRILQQLQLVLYLLNTVQPSSLFLLLQAQLPPNLYKFCQIFGLFIYPNVSDYQSLQIQQEYKLFGLELNKDEVYPDCQLGYSRLGFSNSLLINIPIIVLKYILIFLLIIIIKLISILCYFKRKKPILQKIETILMQRLNTENEINLLLTTLSILLQFRCIDQNSYASRYGLYLAIGLLLYLTSMMIFNYHLINPNNQQNKRSKSKIRDNVYSILFTDRICPNETNTFKRNYFFMQLLKKYIQIFILFIFYPFPQIAASLCGILLLSSSILTIILRPYKSMRSRLIKFVGEMILSICWFLSILIPQIEYQFNKNNLIDDELFQKYIKIGTIIIYLLMIFNTLFIIEYIFQTIQTIADLFPKKIQEIKHPKIMYKKQKQ